MMFTNAQLKLLVIALDMAIDQVRGDEQKAFLEIEEVLKKEINYEQD